MNISVNGLLSWCPTPSLTHDFGSRKIKSVFEKGSRNLQLCCLKPLTMVCGINKELSTMLAYATEIMLSWSALSLAFSLLNHCCRKWFPNPIIIKLFNYPKNISRMWLDHLCGFILRLKFNLYSTCGCEQNHKIVNQFNQFPWTNNWNL